MTSSEPKRWFCAPFRAIKQLLINHEHFSILIKLLLLFELVLGIAIIKVVKYTEIDWIAYMQEVEGFLHGERDYMKLQGDTGPLVYPGFFVWVYSALYYITDQGRNVRLAQWIFLGIYLVFIYVVLKIYQRTRLVPPWATILVCLSHRIHSIFMLRCFNDAIAMLFLYTAVLAFLHRRWLIGNCLFSLAVGMKMNVLLFLPAWMILMLKHVGFVRSLGHGLMMIAVQIGVGYPFLSTYPASYLGRAFEFSRQFFYKWTVNWKMVDESTFLHPWFAKGLLITHLALLFLYFFRKEDGRLFHLPFEALRRDCCSSRSSSSRAETPSAASSSDSNMTESDVEFANEVVSSLFLSNFIGVACARSLHYQFYVWYYHSLPYLLWTAWIPSSILRVAVLFAIEWCWNVFPARPVSSSVLLGCHVVLLLSVWPTLRRRRQIQTKASKLE